MVICGQAFSDDILERIRTTISVEPEISRSCLSRQVCEWLHWRNAVGDLKDMSCRVALLKLHRRGLIDLPAARTGPRSRDVSMDTETLIDEHSSISCSLSELGSVELVRVNGFDRKFSKIWNGLMERYHYLGSGPLCGAQMRYLIRGPRCGWLGGLSFSAAAWSLGARDRWIGWDDRTRRHHLEKVVCNSRFLILPQVKVPYLASHVLGLSCRQIGFDWPNQYGIEPVLLETFVERDRFRGTCYRAANWQHVGSTHGRGRQDSGHVFSVPVKDIYLYPLRPDVRELLCDCAPKGVAERPWPEVSQDWAEEEFGVVDLGDNRLKKRLLNITRDLYARPQASIPQACESRAKTKAAYRFFEHSETRMDRILSSHYESTLSRVNKESVVLAVQDTTTLNYSTHPATADLGLIGSKHEGIIGLLVHDTMAFNLEGTPLGLLDVQCWARNPEDFGKKHLRHELSIEQKESHKWLKSFRTVAQAQKRCPKTIFVSMGDREADIYELFQLALCDSSAPKLLVRAEHDRLLVDGQGHLLERLSQEVLAGIQVIRVPRQGNRPAREARLEVRFAKVTLKPPKGKAALGALSVWAILAKEVDAPEGVIPLKWMLLTTIEVATFEQAIEKLAWYTGRWGIEVYHKTLKSGCKIEERQLGSADRIEACLAIDMVVAWRIYHLTKLGRETPDVPCTVFFEDSEWKALVTYKTQNAIPPEKPPSLREATRMVASLGGFLGRKSDGEPGTQTLWLGLQRLDDLTSMWKFLVSQFAPHLLIPPVSSNPGYG